MIAKAIKQYDIPREKVVILTKCYGPVADDPSLLALTYPELVAKSKDFVNQSGTYDCAGAKEVGTQNHRPCRKWLVHIRACDLNNVVVDNTMGNESSFATLGYRRILHDRWFLRPGLILELRWVVV